MLSTNQSSTSTSLTTYPLDPRGENIVANLSLYNPITSSSPIPASIDVALEKPILRRCKDYKMTILRFQCSLSSIYPNYNLTGKTFVVRLVSGNGNLFEISNTVSPSDVFATITDFVNYINFMLVRLWSGYINRFPTGYTISLAPYIIYNTITHQFELIVPALFNAFDQNIDLQVNDQLYYYLQGIPAVKLADKFYSFQTNVKDDAIKAGSQPQLYNATDIFYISPIYNNILLDNTGRHYPLFGNTPTQFNSYRFRSEFCTDNRFNKFQSVVVLSNIPIRQETLPLPTDLNTPLLNNDLSYIASLPILSDFRANINHYGDQNQDLIYYPPGEYRWIDLISDGPLDRLSFSFKYQTIDQNIHQLMIQPGNSVNIKVYFRSIH
jgi:hypothetical protein